MKSTSFKVLFLALFAVLALAASSTTAAPSSSGNVESYDAILERRQARRGGKRGGGGGAAKKAAAAAAAKKAADAAAAKKAADAAAAAGAAGKAAGGGAAAKKAADAAAAKKAADAAAAGAAGKAAGNAGKKGQVDANAGKAAAGGAAAGGAAAGGAAAGGAAEPPNTKPTGLRNDGQFCKQVGLAGAIHDGTQKKTVTCSTTVQGEIPSFNNMVSTIILSPASGAVVSAAQDMTVAVKTQGINLGFFEDPNTRYYTSPQTLDKAGNIEGHQHVTIQALGSAQAPPNPQTQALAFFKGLDQATNNGILTVTVPAGSMKPGLTRICTMTGGRGHQAVLMPVARRGAQDDCIRITVQ